MTGVSKTYPGANKPVLKNIYLSFFYGAKIGILGLNGSGKSSLLKIIAGLDKSFQGDVVFSSGYKIGYLEQEPQMEVLLEIDYYHNSENLIIHLIIDLNITLLSGNAVTIFEG